MATTEYDLSIWSERILDSLSETGIAVSRVVSWFQNSLYKLNSAIGSGFYVDNGTIYPDMVSNVSGIYEEMYYCDYYRKKATANLGASAYDWVEIRGEDQGSIRRISKNDIAKNYMSMSKECEERLNQLIKWYQSLDTTISYANQILYSDRGTVTDFGLIDFNAPPTHFYSNLNTIWIDNE